MHIRPNANVHFNHFQHQHLNDSLLAGAIDFFKTNKSFNNVLGSDIPTSLSKESLLGVCVPYPMISICVYVLVLVATLSFGSRMKLPNRKAEKHQETCI